MTVNVDVYRYTKKVGTGTCVQGSATVSSYSGVAISGNNKAHAVTLTSGTNVGSTYWTRVVTNNGSSLTLKDPCPYA